MLASKIPRAYSLSGGFALLECALSMTIVISLLIGLASLGDFLHGKWIVGSLCSDAARTLSQPLNSIMEQVNSPTSLGSSLTLRASNTLVLLEQALRQRYRKSIEARDYRFEILLLDNPRQLLAAGGGLQLPSPVSDQKAVRTLHGLGLSGILLVRLGVMPRTLLSQLLGGSKSGYYDERLVVVRSDFSV